MAQANPTLINALRKTADKLKKGAPYQWGHMGSCNCGNLAQEITHLSKAEIHAYAMHRMGDWTEQTLEYCGTSGYPMDLMMTKMLEAGLSLEDLRHLEKLSDQSILRQIPIEHRYLKHNKRDDVVLYLLTWADLLEEEWLKTNPVDLTELYQAKTQKASLVKI
ncbi:hypothetical protein [Penaeicola halotolerans]|uniref:hypothetical protein n=1 Tax=Penaeicola halotolerans TaxID=2793196 RepID=UPI001CF92BBC|nr:hypothetical protein [Penaeicola halotolerans]